jgi:hypothetical protein
LTQLWAVIGPQSVAFRCLTVSPVSKCHDESGLRHMIFTKGLLFRRSSGALRAVITITDCIFVLLSLWQYSSQAASVVVVSAVNA